MPPDRVRLATEQDEDALFTLLMALRDDNNTFGFNVSDARVREHIERGTRKIGGLHGVIDAPDKPGVLAASIGCFWDRWWFSEDWGIAQLWLFVRPEYRAGHHYADELVDWAKAMRDELQIKVGKPIGLVNSVVSEERLDAKLRFWRRHSGALIGGIFEIR